jgi:ABC-type molybdate transport system substrate-binding protein
MLQELINQSPKIDLDEFLGTFKGKVFNGKKGFNKARQYLKNGKNECVVIFHNWWVLLKNGADWMGCFKLSKYMNDWD